MNVLDKETYEWLKKYEQHLTRAYKANYIMGVTTNLAGEFLEVYKRTGGNKHINLACSNCVYTMVKELGEAYFKYQKAEESAAQSENNVEVEQTPKEEKKTSQKAKKTTSAKAKKGVKKDGSDN